MYQVEYFRYAMWNVMGLPMTLAEAEAYVVRFKEANNISDDNLVRIVSVE